MDENVRIINEHYTNLEYNINDKKVSMNMNYIYKRNY